MSESLREVLDTIQAVEKSLLSEEPPALQTAASKLRRAAQMTNALQTAIKTLRTLDKHEKGRSRGDEMLAGLAKAKESLRPLVAAMKEREHEPVAEPTRPACPELRSPEGRVQDAMPARPSCPELRSPEGQPLESNASLRRHSLSLPSLLMFLPLKEVDECGKVPTLSRSGSSTSCGSEDRFSRQCSDGAATFNADVIALEDDRLLSMEQPPEEPEVNSDACVEQPQVEPEGLCHRSDSKQSVFSKFGWCEVANSPPCAPPKAVRWRGTSWWRSRRFFAKKEVEMVPVVRFDQKA